MYTCGIEYYIIQKIYFYITNSSSIQNWGSPIVVVITFEVTWQYI